LAYILWPLIGVLVAALLGVGLRRNASRPNASAAWLADAFGAFIGGIIGDGVPHASEVAARSALAAVKPAFCTRWLAAIAGLYAFEYAFVMAPQEMPNSSTASRMFARGFDRRPLTADSGLRSVVGCQNPGAISATPY
jgi:hypothetical protein